jgi:uncharacterized protein (DUF1330 family)
MTALWIAHVTVTDPEAYGVFLARGGRYQQMEGHDRPRNVVARFPSFDDAVACYNSSAYQAALAHAKAASERDLVIVEETPPPAK